MFQLYEQAFNISNIDLIYSSFSLSLCQEEQNQGYK